MLFLLVFAIVAVFAGPEPEGPAGPISRFPEISVARTVENGLYLAALMLRAPLALALFHRLRGTRPAAALFGSALSVVGLAVLAAGALPHVVTSRLSERYHADGATPGEQATLVLQWEANQAMFDALLLVGLLVMPVGVVLLGHAMRQNPGFGKITGSGAIALGAVAFGAATVMLVDPLSAAAAIGIFALIAFHLLAGWKAYRLSTTASVANAHQDVRLVGHDVAE